MPSALPIVRPASTSHWLVAALLGAALATGCGSVNTSGLPGDSSSGGDGGAAGASAANGGSTLGGNGGTTQGPAGQHAGTGGAGVVGYGGSGGSSPGSGGDIGSVGGGAASGGSVGSAGGGAANGGSTSNGGNVASGGSVANAGTRGSGGKSGAGGATGTGGAAGSSGLDHQIQGVYCGNSTDAVTQFEGWFGKQTGGILGYTGNASWMDFDGSVGWAASLWGALDRRVLWSVPLIPTGANLADAAAGMYDDHYTKAAQTLAKYRPQESVLYIRTGWEFNGDWFPWTAQGGKAKSFAGAFQHFVAAFRAVSSRFRFEWNVNLGGTAMNPEDAYPGDASVDIIGMDFYWNLQYDSADPNAAWNSKVTQTYGLKWHQDFAAAHHKPTAYSEWGIMSDKAGPYIQQAKAWFTSHDVVYQTYWNSNASFTGQLSSGQYPNAGAAYKAAFGP